MRFSTLRAACGVWLTVLLASGAARAAAVADDQRTLEFVENKGQWDERAAFVAELPAGRLFLAPTRLTYAFADPAALAAHHDHRPDQPAELRAHAYSVSFEGANPRAALLSGEPTAGRRNYFRGGPEKGWVSGAIGYRTLRTAGLYPGIDLRLYENADQQLEYDFTLQPGARPGAIRLRYRGADELRLSEGNLLIRTSVGSVTEQAPRAWQELGGRRVAVPCAFVLTGDVLTFEVGKYDAGRPLVIDPTVVFSSFTGSTADNWGFTATYDQAGHMYSGGIVFSLGYPTTTGAYSTKWSGLTDIGIIKYDTKATGRGARLYATYLGGSSADVPHSLVVNAQEELIILGSTSSTNFPTTPGAYDRTYNGGQKMEPDNGLEFPNGSDLFVAKLSSDGARLLAATYLGGSANDGVMLQGAGGLVQNYGDQFRGDVITDAAGNVYLASSTSSTNFPTANGFQGAYRGGATDAVVCKFAPDLSKLLWSSLLGGPGADAAYSIQLDQDRNVLVGGGTNGGLPATAGSYQPTYRGGIDGFVARIGADGRTLERTTYLGTDAYDQAYFIQLDHSANVYVFGQTRGAYPVTAGRYTTPGGRQFIHKLLPDLTQSVYSTVFGAGQDHPDLSPTAFLVDDCERIYISCWGGVVNRGFGTGTTAGLPTTANAVQRTTDGSDFYLAEFTPDMLALDYATFYGESGSRSGEHVDGGTSRFDRRGSIYQAVCGGCGGSSGFPVPPGVNTYSKVNSSTNCNNAAFKINFEILVADPGPTRYLCPKAAPVALGGTPGGGTWSGDGVTGGGAKYQFDPAKVQPGAHILTYTVRATGVCLSTRTVRYVVVPDDSVTLAAVPPQCTSSTATVPLTASVAGGVWSGPGVAGSAFSPAKAGAGTHTLTYALPDSVHCGAITLQITVVAPPVVSAGPAITRCANETAPFQLTGATPANGTWSGPGVTAAGRFTPPDTRGQGAIITLKYISVLPDGSCPTTAERTIVLAPVSAADVRLNVPECPVAPQFTGLAPLLVQFAPALAGGTYEWDFGDQATSTDAAPSHEYAKGGSYRVRLTARYAGCVVVTQFAPVEVADVFVPNIITPNGDDKNETFVPRFSCQPAELKVFDRWGKEVYQTAAYRNDWRGENLPDGTYYYHLRDAAGRTLKGWVQINR